MRIEIPEFALVALIGATSSGKSTFAKKHFLPTEILSSDFFRGMVSDDENNQKVSREAFDLLRSKQASESYEDDCYRCHECPACCEKADY